MSSSPSSARQVIALYGHAGDIRSLAFHPDGKVLASGSSDNTVRLWDVDPAHNPELRVGAK